MSTVVAGAWRSAAGPIADGHKISIRACHDSAGSYLEILCKDVNLFSCAVTPAWIKAATKFWKTQSAKMRSSRTAEGKRLRTFERSSKRK